MKQKPTRFKSGLRLVTFLNYDPKTEFSGIKSYNFFVKKILVNHSKQEWVWNRTYPIMHLNELHRLVPKSTTLVVYFLSKIVILFKTKNLTLNCSSFFLIICSNKFIYISLRTNRFSRFFIFDLFYLEQID